MPPEAESLLAILQPTAIVAGLLLSALAAWRQHRSQQVATLVALAKSHREIWERVFDRPALSRVSDPAANIAVQPVSIEERLFILLLTLHLYTVYEAARSRVMRGPYRQDRDVAAFFSAPVARRVWEDLREYQEPRFRAYVEALIEARIPPLHG